MRLGFWLSGSDRHLGNFFGRKPCRLGGLFVRHDVTTGTPAACSGSVKRRFNREEMDRWLTERGVTLIGAGLDESPMAYRRLPEVIAQHAGTVKVLHTLRSFAVVMAGEEEFDPFKD